MDEADPKDAFRRFIPLDLSGEPALDLTRSQPYIIEIDPSVLKRSRAENAKRSKTPPSGKQK